MAIKFAADCNLKSSPVLTTDSNVSIFSNVSKDGKFVVIQPGGKYSVYQIERLELIHSEQLNSPSV